MARIQRTSQDADQRGATETEGVQEESKTSRGEMKTGFLLFILFLLGILTVPLVVSGCGLVETRDDIFISADGATITVILGICEKK